MGSDLNVWKEERQTGRYGWLCVQEWSNEYR